jgi:hypothetical protein
MKKTILSVLVLVMVFALAACGSKDNSIGTGSDDPLSRPGGASSAQDTNSPEGDTPNMADILSGSGGGALISGLDKAAKQDFIDDAKADGYDVVFTADGGMVMTDTATGDVVTQNADGTWKIDDASGDQVQVGGDWPNNEFTKLVAKPDFTFVGASTSADSFGVGFSDVTVEQVKDYTEKVKAKGFTISPDVQDEDLMGMVIFLYSAKNADGYSVEIAFSAGTAGLTITKP